MIIVKAPLRISFVGGGSDLPSHYKEHGGACFSMAINKYVYVMVNKRFEASIRLSYSKTEIVNDVEELEHDIAREIFKSFGILYGIEVVSIADIPGSGTGLGSSSSFAVAMTLALKEYLSLYESGFTINVNEKPTKEYISNLACVVEIDRLGKPIGKQDQYASAYGGINLFVFEKNGDVDVMNIPITPKIRNYLSDHLMLFYTGITRKSSDVLNEQNEKNKLGHNDRHLNKMKDMAYVLYHNFIGGNISNLGDFLHENWMLKKELASHVSNPNIDIYYEIAMQNGATGGKITGAGGGGFLLIHADPENKTAIRQALGLKEISIKPDDQGARVIFMEGLHD